MLQGTASEKASSSSGGVSVCSRSDDERASAKVIMSAAVDEGWPTLDQSQEQATKKKTKASSSNGTPRGETKSNVDRTRKQRQSRGVPLSPEEQDKLFRHEKSERLVKERRERSSLEKDRMHHQRRHSIQNEMRPPPQPKTPNKETSDPEGLPVETQTTTASSQTPRDTTPRYGQTGRGRGRYGGRFHRQSRGGRGVHPRSCSQDSAFYGMHPPAGMHPMYHPVHMMHPMYYPAMPFAPMAPIPGMMYPAGPHPAVHMPRFSREQIVEAARKQTEYYLSEENLEKDRYLRTKMDNDGWIPLGVIMNFNRLRMITLDSSLILEALYNSEMIDVSEDMAFIRTQEFERWVLPEDQQELVHVFSHHHPYVPGTSTVVDPSRPPAENVFQFDEDHTTESATGQAYLQDQEDSSETDLDRLIVVIQGHGSGSHAKGTFVDRGKAEVINEGLAHYQKQIQPLSSKSVRGEPREHFFSSSLPKNSPLTGRRSSDESHVRQSPSVGWILGTTPQGRSPSATSSPTVEGLHLGTSLPRFDHPGHTHLKEGNFVQVHYNKFYSRGIKDRNVKGFGKSHEMKTLYRFWCYFLRDNYNSRMYSDFKKFAIEDSEEGERYGIECLFNFYSYGLESDFNEARYTDFEDITLMDFEGGSRYGLEKFWAFHHYGGIPETSTAHVNPKLKELIDTSYSTLDDVRQEPESSGALNGTLSSQHQSKQYSVISC